MKKFFVIFVFLLSALSAENKNGKIDAFLEKFSAKKPFQDLVVRGKMIKEGIMICRPRFEMIKPILDQYKSKFSVLDIGAAQGFFSFSIAHRYPHATTIMIEHGEEKYHLHNAMLMDLCVLNDLSNVVFLNKRLAIADFQLLKEMEHFDVVLAFLVIHQIGNTLEELIEVFDEIVQLGDNVIIELAVNDTSELAIEFLAIVEDLSMNGNYDATCLGKVKRSKVRAGEGQLFWFRNNKSSQEKHFEGISKENFEKFNGRYPLNYSN